jgi:hypothetical protein
MIIRQFRDGDLEVIKRIHANSGLPVNCLPDVFDSRFVVKRIAENGTGPMMGGFLKLVGEIFLLVDHQHGTPEQRWEALQCLTAEGLFQASHMGLDCVTAWIPPEIEDSFAKRLGSLGFEKSKWNSYSAIL